MKRSTIWLIVIVLILIVIIFSTGNRDAGVDPAAISGWQLNEAGLMTPESVLYDAVADVYLVSNINGSPADMDDNGFISRISPTGEILDLKWIDGENENVQLSAPKGMAIIGEVLYVTDISSIRLFDKETGEPVGSIDIPGSTFLNDLAPNGKGGVFLTDSGLNPDFTPSGTDAVYSIDAAGEITQLATGEVLGGPNGVTSYKDGALIVTFGGNSILKLGMDGEVSLFAELPTGSLDGIEIIKDGTVLVSSWEGQVVYAVHPDGSVNEVISGVQSPADIGFDSKRGLVLIPLFQLDGVHTVPVTTP